MIQRQRKKFFIQKKKKHRCRIPEYGRREMGSRSINRNRTTPINVQQ